MGRLEYKVALVKEASRGIGRATARRFAQEGARVCLSDVNGDGAKTPVEELDEEGSRVLRSRFVQGNHEYI